MSNENKIHYEPNTCGATGIIRTTTNITMVTCKNCINKNEMLHFDEKQKIMKCNFKYIFARQTFCSLPRPSLSEPRCAEEDCIFMKILKSMEEK